VAKLVALIENADLKTPGNVIDERLYYCEQVFEDNKVKYERRVLNGRLCVEFIDTPRTRKVVEKYGIPLQE
jgi:hypothetical protein